MIKLVYLLLLWIPTQLSNLQPWVFLLTENVVKGLTQHKPAQHEALPFSSSPVWKVSGFSLSKSILRGCKADTEGTLMQFPLGLPLEA